MFVYLKKYGFITIGLLLLIILIIVINYTNDLSKDYKALQNQFIREKQNYVFLGDSITYGYQLDEFYDDYYVVNSGVSGDVTGDILNDLENRVYKYNPTKIFLLIGINDIKNKENNKVINSNIKKIVRKINKNRPYAKIYIESVYPVNEKKLGSSYSEISNKKITNLNKLIKQLCEDYDMTYIDVGSALVDDNGSLKEKYTEDGLHLNGLGYYKVTKALKKYVKEKV